MNIIDIVHRGMAVLERLSRVRLLVMMCIFLAGIGTIYYINRTSLETPSTHIAFDDFPKTIGAWIFSSSNTLSPEIEKMLGADSYMDYIYRSPDHGEIEVLVSYFSSMHEGKQFHSPKNCMLGSGWEPQEIKEIYMNWRGKQVPVNFMMVRKNSKILYVSYWVQGRGRILASEYQERIYRVIDAIVRRRSDGAFVRISLPGGPEDRLRAERQLTAVATEVAVDLGNYLPR